MLENNIFEQHDHTAIFILLFIFSELFFLYSMTKILRQMKKSLVELINQLLYSAIINRCDSKNNRQYHIHFFSLESFLGENRVCSFGFLSAAESFSYAVRYS